MAVCDLYKKTNYLDKDIEGIFGELITEYDIESAGYNIIKHFKFCDEEVIERIEKLPKKMRHIYIGNLMREDDSLRDKMKKGFKACRKKLFEENEIVATDIISIKKDAIFIRNRELQYTEFDNIRFRKKNEYNSYLYMNKIEFYLTDDRIDCKGIKDEFAEYHQEYMFDIFREFSSLMRNNNRKKALEFIKNVAHLYRTKQLATGYYRELNTSSMYRLKEPLTLFGNQLGLIDCDNCIDKLETWYNYVNYLVPLFRMVI